MTKEAKKKRSKLSPEEAKKRHNEANKRYRIRNKKKLTDYNKKKYQENKEYHKLYRISNAEKIRIVKRNYMRVSCETNPSVKIRKNIRKQIYSVIKSGYKSDNTIGLVGCSATDLIKHLESQFEEGMTWENYGRNGWHIDHIVPCALFDLTRPEQQKSCFNYKNLQPLWESENCSKQDHFDLCPI